MTSKPSPTFELEQSLAGRIHPGPIAGIDEAGRGAWCGPVVAAAVVLDPANTPDGLNDSKLLTPKRREALYAAVREVASVGVGIASPEEIDAIGIGKATLLAMARATEALPEPPVAALVDGNVPPDLGSVIVETVVKGDSRSQSIAAASIIAKVTRDRLLVELDAAHPGYGWASNKGYGAKAHADALAALGVTPHHRKSYAPIKAHL